MILYSLVFAAIAGDVSAPIAPTIAPSTDARLLPNRTVVPVEASGIDASSLIGAPAGPPLKGDALREQTHIAAKLLRCVVCQGLSVADSPSETARAMRTEVEKLVAQGYDTDQILMYFEASYGEFVLLDPRREGFNWLVWGLPFAALAGGAALIGVTLRRRAATTPAAEVDDPYLRRVRRETRPPGEDA